MSKRRRAEAVVCPICGGSGRRRCRKCSGGGMVANNQPGPSLPKEKICPDCNGTGEGEGKCNFCNDGKISLAVV